MLFRHSKQCTLFSYRYLDQRAWDHENDKVPPDSQEQEPYLPLHRAAFAGRVADVESIVVSGECDVNNLYDGQTALHTAAEQGCVGVVAKLVELGCDMYKTDNNGLTALHHERDQVDVVAKLVELRLTTRD